MASSPSIDPSYFPKKPGVSIFEIRQEHSFFYAIPPRDPLEHQATRPHPLPHWPLYLSCSLFTAALNLETEFFGGRRSDSGIAAQKVHSKYTAIWISFFLNPSFS